MWLQRHLGFYHSAVVCGAKVVDLLTRPFTSGEWFPNFVGARYDARYGVDTYKLKVDPTRSKTSDRG